MSHDTALTLYDLGASRSHEIHLTLPRAHRPRAPQSTSRIKLHTTVVPLRRDEVASHFGVQITSPARTIADVADIGADPSLVIDATARALASGIVSPSELRSAIKGRSARVHQLVDKAIHEAGARA